MKNPKMSRIVGEVDAKAVASMAAWRAKSTCSEEGAWAEAEEHKLGEAPKWQKDFEGQSTRLPEMSRCEMDVGQQI